MHKIFLFSFSYKNNLLSSKIDSPTTRSHKKEGFLSPSSGLKYHDSYASSINWANLTIECLCSSAFFLHPFSFLSLLCNPSQSLEPSIRLIIFLPISPIFLELQYKSPSTTYQPPCYQEKPLSYPLAHSLLVPLS